MSPGDDARECAQCGDSVGYLSSRDWCDGCEMEVPELGAWTRRAACIAADPEVFYPSRGDDPRAAKAICATCPVVDECLQWALDHDETYGVWGGLSEDERRELRGS